MSNSVALSREQRARLKAATQVYAGQVLELKAKRADLMLHREKILVGSQTRADVDAAVDHVVDALAAPEIPDMEDLIRNLAPRFEEPLAGGPRTLRPGQLPDRLRGLFGPLNVNQLAFLVPAALKAGLRARIAAYRWEEGAPLAERPGMLAELDEQIAAIEAELLTIYREGVADGITVELPGDMARALEAQRIHDEHGAAEHANYERANSGLLGRLRRGE
jgi:hypothetical protein